MIENIKEGNIYVYKYRLFYLRCSLDGIDSYHSRFDI